MAARAPGAAGRFDGGPIGSAMARSSMVAGRGNVGRVIGAAVAVMLVLGCTADQAPDPVEVPVGSDDEEPPALVGARVGVVLPPADAWHPAMIEAMRRDVRVVQSMARQGVREIRTVVPDDEVFVEDLVEFLANGQSELTCALTTSASSAVRVQHANLPHKRFCAVVTASLTTEEGPGYDVVVLRTAELGHVVGAAAAIASSTAVTFALAPHELEQGRFLDGMLAGLGQAVVIEPDPELDPVDAVVAAIDEGADVVIVGGGPDAPDIVGAAIDAGALVLAPDPITSGLDSEAIVLTWRTRWDRVLRGPVDRLLGRDDAVPLSLGFDEGAFVVRFGGGVPPGVNATVRRLTDEIATGARDPVAIDPNNGSSPVP